MTAEEMFDRLGYYKSVDTVTSISYHNNKLDTYIAFDIQDKTVYSERLVEYANGLEFEAKHLSMPEIEAIVQQIKELGW